VAWALILAITWPIVALREIDFSLVAAATLNTPNGLLAPPPATSAAGVVLTALGQLVGLLWLDFLWARFGTHRLAQADRIVFLPMVMSIALACAVALWQKTMDLTWLSVEPWPRLERASGLMLDANSFGTAAAIWAPLGLAVIWRRGWPTPIGVVLTTLLAAGMWTSGSRTALLIAAIGLTAILAALLWRSRSSRSRYAALALLLGAALAIVVVSVRGDDQSSPLARLLDTIPGAAEGGVPQLARDLWERNGYGIAAARAIEEHPLTGVGVGAFPLLAPEYFRLETGGIIPGDNAQNWWRHQMAELGVLGALPAVAVSVGVLSMIVIGTPGAANRAVTTLLRGTLVGIGLASLVGVSTQHPALFITFVTIVFWLGALLGAPVQVDAPPATWWGVGAFAVAIAVGQAVSGFGDLRVPHRALAHGFEYGYGFSEPEADPVLGVVRHTRRHAVGVIVAEHAYFHLTLIAPQATTGDPVQVKLWRGRDLIVDQRVSGPEPIVRYVGVRPGERRLMIEVDVSRTAPDGTGLTLAGTWMRELPAGANPGLVVQ
jgi:O-antigen ligase